MPRSYQVTPVGLVAGDRHNGSQANPKSGSKDTSQITGDQILSPGGTVPTERRGQSVNEQGHAALALVRQREGYLWPDALTPRQQTAVTDSEVVRVYPHRANVPHERWQQLLGDAEERIDILV
jgi:hypothetical protein